MVMTQPALLFMGFLATVAGIGVFLDFGDDATRVILAFLSAAVWSMFGIGSFDVIVRESSFASQSEPIMPLVFLGVGMAAIFGLFGLYSLLMATKTEVEATSDSNMLQ